MAKKHGNFPEIDPLNTYEVLVPGKRPVTLQATFYYPPSDNPQNGYQYVFLKHVGWSSPTEKKWELVAKFRQDAVSGVILRETELVF